MDIIIKALPAFAFGVYQTLKITILAVGLGCLLGLIGGLGRLSGNRVLRFLATCYVDFIRGTPLLVQIFIVYFGFPQLLKELDTFVRSHMGIVLFQTSPHIEAFVAAAISCSINSGAYVAEIFRAGIQSIEKGQMEAALSLGMTPKQAMRYIILPQAFRRIVPPLGNEFIAMLKDTSLLVVIGYVELTRTGQLIIADTFRAFEVWMFVALLYLLMTLSISRLVDFTERRLGVRGHHQS